MPSSPTEMTRRGFLGRTAWLAAGGLLAGKADAIPRGPFGPVGRLVFVATEDEFPFARLVIAEARGRAAALAEAVQEPIDLAIARPGDADALAQATGVLSGPLRDPGSPPRPGWKPLIRSGALPATDTLAVRLADAAHALHQTLVEHLPKDRPAPLGILAGDPADPATGAWLGALADAAEAAGDAGRYATIAFCDPHPPAAAAELERAGRGRQAPRGWVLLGPWAAAGPDAFGQASAVAEPVRVTWCAGPGAVPLLASGRLAAIVQPSVKRTALLWLADEVEAWLFRMAGDPAHPAVLRNRGSTLVAAWREEATVLQPIEVLTRADADRLAAAWSQSAG